MIDPFFYLRIGFRNLEMDLKASEYGFRGPGRCGIPECGAHRGHSIPPGFIKIHWNWTHVLDQEIYPHMCFKILPGSNMYPITTNFDETGWDRMPPKIPTF